MRYARILFLTAEAVVLLWLFLPTNLGGSTSFIVVNGRSMEPIYRSGDLIITRRQMECRIGDIITFAARDPQTGRISGNVVHRIRSGSPDDGFITRGDNKSDDDPWRPKLDDILGKVWFHIPRAGQLVVQARTPRTLAILIGGFAIIGLVGGAETKRRIRRRGREGKMAIKAIQLRRKLSFQPLQIPSIEWLVGIGGLLAIVAIAGGALAYLSYTQPTTRTQAVEKTLYDQTVAFDYTVQASASTLYPDGAIGPVRPGADAPSARPPIYAKLAKSLDLGYAYTLKTPDAAEISGDIAASVELRGSDGWVKVLERTDPVPFSGPTASGRVQVDLAGLQALVAKIESETGVKGSGYTLTVFPIVRVAGKVGATQVSETYTPAFTVKLDQAKLTPDVELVKSQPRKTSASVTQDQTLRVVNWTLPVAQARQIATFGFGLGLLGLLVVLGSGYRLYSRDVGAQARTRYGSLLVVVSADAPEPTGQKIPVASLHDLARLAQQDGQVIFQRPSGEGSSVYYVQRGDLTYRYTAGGTAVEG